jgi:hypothetical protein
MYAGVQEGDVCRCSRRGCTQVFKKESVDDMGVALSAVLLIVTIGQRKNPQKA